MCVCVCVCVCVQCVCVCVLHVCMHVCYYILHVCHTLHMQSFEVIHTSTLSLCPVHTSAFPHLTPLTVNLSLLLQHMPTKTLEFLITLEDYPESDTCKVSLSSVGILQKLTVYDVMRRPLVLTVECVAKGKQAIEVQYLQYIVVQCIRVQALKYGKCL